MKLQPLASVIASTYNPRTADADRLSLVELSLRKLGFLLPIYATPAGEILSGHQRHLVAARMGCANVPVAITGEMDLQARKGINIVFNRATNDMAANDTPEALTATLATRDVRALAADLPDRTPDTPEFYPCLNAVDVSVSDLCRVNAGRWIAHSANVARALGIRKIDMPIICRRDNWVVNGIGRLENAAEKKRATIAVVYVTDAEAVFAEAMLNCLTMSFDIHTRYADALRYNSFRRPRGARANLGRAFTFDLIGAASSVTFDVTDPAGAARWKKHYGTTVCDFGAGLLDETRLLRSVGVDAIPFEPYLLNADKQIDVVEARTLTRAFLARVKHGVRFNTVFLSAVLNSVPFIADRRHIMVLLNALCSADTRVNACSQSVKAPGYLTSMGASYLNKNDGARMQFALGYEPRVSLGEFATLPKMQKYHTAREWYDLWRERFGLVRVTESSNNVNCVCAKPLPITLDLLESAVAFEFDLPYPDGSRLGLAAEALDAFRALLTATGRLCRY